MNPDNKIYQDYQFLWKNKMFLFLLVLFIVLNILDVSLTYYGVEYKELKEGNPLFANSINVEKDYGLVFSVKFCYTVVISLFVFFIFKYYSDLFGYFLIYFLDLFLLKFVFDWVILLI